MNKPTNHHNLHTSQKKELSISESDDNNEKKLSSISSICSEELCKIQTKDINNNTKILCKFFSKVLLSNIIDFLRKKNKKRINILQNLS